MKWDSMSWPWNGSFGWTPARRGTYPTASLQWTRSGGQIPGRSILWTRYLLYLNPTLSLVGLPFQAAPLIAHRHPPGVTRRQVQTHAALARSSSQQRRPGLAIAITAFLKPRGAPQWPIRTRGSGGPTRTDNKGARTRFARSTARLPDCPTAVRCCAPSRRAAGIVCPATACRAATLPRPKAPANQGSFRTALCS